MKKLAIVIGSMIIALTTNSCQSNPEQSEKTDTTIPTVTHKTTKEAEQKAYYYGIDVSHWNGDIVADIDKMDDLTFGICKATQGISYVDPDFAQNFKTLQQKGLIFGAYHFYISSDDPKTQADHYYHTIAGDDKPLQMACIVDIEAGSIDKKGITAEAIQKDLFTFLDHIESLSGRTPIIYTGYSFANEYLTDTKLSKYPLWLAEYSGGQSPMIPTVWKDKGYMIWQKTDRHDLNSNEVDYDQYYGLKSGLF